jgi:hypothetical protein
MKTRISILLAALALLAIGNLAPAATITWTNTSGGYWSDAANWSPNQVPTNTDNALITTPGTYTVALDVGSIGYPHSTNVANLTLGAGGGATGVQTFVVTNLAGFSTFLVNSQLLVTNGGVLQMTNGYLAGNSLIIAKGGVFNGQGESLIVLLAIVDGGVLNTANGSLLAYNPVNGNPSMIVTNGGVLNANGDSLGSVTVANGGLCLANGVAVLDQYLGYGMTVAHGGVLDITNGLGLYGPLTNAGIVNVTNSAITIYNFNTGDQQYGIGGLVNQAGGLINLQGSGSIGGIHYVYQSVPYDYFINQGIMTKTGGTNSFDCQVFDNSQGTITNFSGTLVLGTYQTNLAGIYFAAAGSTVQFNAVNDDTNFVTAGTPLVLGGSGLYQFLSGYLYYPSNTIPNLALQGTTLKLGPGFQGGAITNLALDGIYLSNSLPVTGTFAVTNSPVLGNFAVANGGVFTGNNASTYGNITVASGGLFIANGGSAYTLGYPSFSGSLTVAHGGVVNLAGNFGMNAPFTNAGTVNISNAVINVNVGIINQAGGLMNFGNNVGIYAGAYVVNFFTANPNSYFINQGMVVQLPGTATTNTISCPASAQVGNQQISINLAFNFDNSQGTITNLSGTLALPGFQTNLAGTFYAAAGTTIQFGGGTAATPLVPGTPLVLGGSGQYQFFSGYLYFPINMIPNLSLVAGLLELGPRFQGGAITNLAINGMALTNQLSTTLPIQGTFTVLNSGSSGSLNYLRFVGWDGFYGNGIYGNYTVAVGGVLNASNATMNGAVTVAGSGIMNMMGASMFGPLTVASGGLITATGHGGVIYPSSMLLIAAGGTMNITGSGINLNGPLNNAGTINITNVPGHALSGIFSYNNSLDNNSTTIFGTNLGGVFNQASGLINLGSDGAYLSASGGGYEYIVNQGRITKSVGTSLSAVVAPFTTNSGAITVQSGIIFMRPLVTLPGGSLNISLNSATNYGSFLITSNIVLAGAFNATLANGYVPTSGTSFSVMTYSNYSGSFSSLGLPSAVNWQSSYGSTNFTLVAGSPKPQFGTFNLSGTSLIFSGIGGSPGSNYVVLASTNLTIPLANWSALTTNTFDGSGQFRYTNPVSPVKPRQFFIFKLP